MELKFDAGAYVKNKYGGFATVSGEDETVQRVLMKLSARRGAFAPLPSFGSELYTLPRLKPSQRETAARQMVHEALAGETDVTVTDVSYAEKDGDTAVVTVALSIGGGAERNVAVTV